MRKIAIFSEGQTEQLFAVDLIKTIAREKKLLLKKERAYGGRRFPTIWMQIDADEGDQAECDFYFLLVDCASDSRVVTAINERYDGLVAQGFETIIGIRDLRPDFGRDELQKVLSGAHRVLRNDKVLPLLVIATMETEAWIISENDHFTKLNATLTKETILDQTGIDISGNSEDIEVPADSLNEMYEIAGLSYSKSRSDVIRTLEAVDMSAYARPEVIARAPSLQPLLHRLTQVLSEA